MWPNGAKGITGVLGTSYAGVDAVLVLRWQR